MQSDGEHRVIYIGAESQPHKGFWGRMIGRESNSGWRRQLAAEMEDACQEMTRRGHRLLQVVPVLNTAYEKGGWTEGAWLFFGPAESESR
jgi:hypothetical protein